MIANLMKTTTTKKKSCLNFLNNKQLSLYPNVYLEHWIGFDEHTGVLFH